MLKFQYILKGILLAYSSQWFTFWLEYYLVLLFTASYTILGKLAVKLFSINMNCISQILLFLVVQLTVLMVYIFLYGKTYLVRSFYVNLVLCNAIIVAKLLAISICQFVIFTLLNVVINLYFYVYVIDSEVMHSSNSFSRFNVFNLTFVIHPSLVTYLYMTSVNFLHFFSLFIFHSFLKVTLGPA